jgi:hypothetical protein
MAVDENCDEKRAVLFVFENVGFVLLLLSVVVGTDRFELCAKVDFSVDI